MHNANPLRKTTALLVLVLALAGAAQALELRMSHTTAADGAIGQAVDFFAARIKERTGGRYVVNTFHSGSLGGERENIEDCQLGNLDIGVVNQSVLGNFIPEIQVVDLPYVIQDYAHADKIFLGDIGKGFLARLDEVGLKGLSIWESGFRNLTNNKRDVNSVDDVKGLRIRVMENQIHQALWRSLGADAVPMAWGEAYTAMQQGAIDGQENPLTIIDKNNVVEVNKRLAITQHCYATVFVIMSPSRWESLSAEDKKIFQECMDEASDKVRTLARQMDKEAIQSLEDKGMKVTYPDKQGFIDKSAGVRTEFGKRFAQALADIEALK